MRTLIAVLSFIALLPSTGYTHADDLGQMYTGICHDALFSAIGFEAKERMSVTSNGIIYRSKQPQGLSVIVLGVYPSSSEAHGAFRYYKDVRPIGPSTALAGEPIGDEFAWWHRADETVSPTVSGVIRRSNLVLHFSWIGDSTGALVVLRQTDALIRDNRQVAPLGTFSEMPEILDPGVPTTLSVRPMKEVLPYDPASGTGTRDGQPELRNPGGKSGPLAFVNIQPQFRGLGDVNKLRLVLVGESGYGNLLQDDRAPAGREFSVISPPYYVPDGPDRVRAVRRSQAVVEGVDGRFIMRVAVPDAPKTHKLTLVAATENNLIVSKKIQVQIVPGN